MRLRAWGRLSHDEHHAVVLGRDRRPGDAAGSGSRAIVYGRGRSYGDVGLNPGGVAMLSRGLDRFLEFNDADGMLTCEAGVSLGQIQSQFAPRGWMLPVTPGTQFATVGGAIANDVHGKNHHRAGCFGNHLHGILLERSDGSRLRCSQEENSDYFAASIGGLGLTGIIREATLQLRPVTSCCLDTETLPYGSAEEFLALSDDSENDWEYTVSWVDCARSDRVRGIFIRANHCEDSSARCPAASRSLSVPVTPPIPLVNRFTLPAFNSLYYWRQCSKRSLARQHYSSFFYPLDAVRDWNRLYGRRGFYQYQLVIPRDDAASALQSLKEISRSGLGSFLSVLKTFGDRPSPGMLSFPMPGVTLALDFPGRRDDRLEGLFLRLDAIVREAGGRLYPAKDARMSADRGRSARRRRECRRPCSRPASRDWTTSCRFATRD